MISQANVPHQVKNLASRESFVNGRLCGEKHPAPAKICPRPYRCSPRFGTSPCLLSAIGRLRGTRVYSPSLSSKAKTEPLIQKQSPENLSHIKCSFINRSREVSQSSGLNWGNEKVEGCQY